MRKHLFTRICKKRRRVSGEGEGGRQVVSGNNNHQLRRFHCFTSSGGGPSPPPFTTSITHNKKRNQRTLQFWFLVEQQGCRSSGLKHNLTQNKTFSVFSLLYIFQYENCDWYDWNLKWNKDICLYIKLKLHLTVKSFVN